MKNTIGNSISVTLFGESHSREIGAVVDGISPGIEINKEYIEYQLTKRRPQCKISTNRVENDNYRIISGVKNDKTTGAPLTVIIENNNVRDNDYDEIQFLARPSHADYSANEKYHGFQDSVGGGHFSGRLTAPLVFIGGILKYALMQKGIIIGTHINSIGDVYDRSIDDIKTDIEYLNSSLFACLDNQKANEMKSLIEKVKNDGDSIGGTLETVVFGIPAGVGEPWFDNVESAISKAIFSIPAIKGIEFGSGFEFSKMLGSTANDEMYFDGEKVITKTNHSGGICGGITNGMPIIFRTSVKPTPTIFKEQETINVNTKENTILKAKGRHDPCIVPRAVAVQDAMTAIAISDLLALRYGTDYLYGGKK